MAADQKGTLLLLGTGIQSAAHLTADARHFLKTADEVLFLTSDAYSEQIVRSLRPDAKSLAGHYAQGKQRMKSYQQMVKAILAPVRAGKTVAVGAYGHPGVFATAPHVALRIAREEGHYAEMLPAISALDCLFADLGLDPVVGLTSYEATVFAARRLAPDPHAILVLWQIGTLGETRYSHAPHTNKLHHLQEQLAGTYGADHEVILYQAASTPGLKHKAHRIRLGGLATAPIAHATTLVVPPRAQAVLDGKSLKRLGLSASQAVDCLE
jgi:uncharacterized protein YabN with tetrapyrrole methylase and pyrophosphatase domain